MSELLQPIEFGRLTLLVGAAALAVNLVSTPRLQAVIRFYPEEQKNKRLLVLRQTAASLIHNLLIMAAIVISIGGGIFSLFTDNPWFIGILIAVMLVIDTFFNFEQTFLNAGRLQRNSALMQTANAWVRPLTAIGSVWMLGSKAESALIGYVIGSALVLLIWKIICRHETTNKVEHIVNPLDSKYQIELSSAIKRYALPLAPLAVFGWLSGMGDRYIIAEILPMADVGLYAAIYGLTSRPFLMLSAIIEQTLRPVFHNAISDDDTKEINSAKKKMLFTTIGGSIVGVIAFLFLKNIAAYLFLSENFRSAAWLMPWIALGYAFLCVSTVFTRICYAFDSTRYVLVQTVAGSLFGVIVLIPAAYFFGLKGAVIAVPVRFGLELALSILLSHKAENTYAGKKNKKTNQI